METYEIIELEDKLDLLRDELRKCVSVCGDDIDSDTRAIFKVVFKWLTDNTESIKFR